MGTPQESGIPFQAQHRSQAESGDTESQTSGASLQVLYQENINPIYRYIYTKVGNREEAQDLTSQTFMKALRLLNSVHSPQSIQSWLFQVARTTVADYWRMRYRVSSSSLEALLDTGWEGPIHEETIIHERANQAERVRLVLEALPANYREVLTCRFLSNLSIKETADRMGLTETNVKVLQFRALKRAADLYNSVISPHGD